MPSEVVTELIRLGVLGPILVVTGWFVWQQHKTIEEMHKARAEETKQFVDRLFALNTAWQEVLNSHSSVMTDTVGTLTMVKDTLADVNDTLKEVSKQQYSLITVSARLQEHR